MTLVPIAIEQEIDFNISNFKWMSLYVHYFRYNMIIKARSLNLGAWLPKTFY